MYLILFSKVQFLKYRSYMVQTVRYKFSGISLWHYWFTTIAKTKFFLYLLLLIGLRYLVFSAALKHTKEKSKYFIMCGLLALLYEMLLQVWSFKEAANTHLKLAGNCFLLSDSSCISVGLIETSAPNFFFYSSCPECSEVSPSSLAL